MIFYIFGVKAQFEACVLIRNSCLTLNFKECHEEKENKATTNWRKHRREEKRKRSHKLKLGRKVPPQNAKKC
jgi:hypothetical protein